MPKDFNASFSPEGARADSAIDNEVFEAAVSAKRVCTVPDPYQMRMDYVARTDGQPVYLAYAARGLSTASSGWLLFKFTYDGSDRVTLRQVAFDSYDNRASATYS